MTDNVAKAGVYIIGYQASLVDYPGVPAMTNFNSFTLFIEVDESAKLLDEEHQEEVHEKA